MNRWGHLARIYLTNSKTGALQRREQRKHRRRRSQRCVCTYHNRLCPPDVKYMYLYRPRHATKNSTPPPHHTARQTVPTSTTRSTNRLEGEGSRSNRQFYSKTPRQDLDFSQHGGDIKQLGDAILRALPRKANSAGVCTTNRCTHRSFIGAPGVRGRFHFVFSSETARQDFCRYLTQITHSLTLQCTSTSPSAGSWSAMAATFLCGQTWSTKGRLAISASCGNLAMCVSSLLLL